jgi:O-antigen/teichoic acid export membrane protein
MSAQLVSGVVLFAGSLVMARLLTPAEIGIYAFGFATAGLVNIFGTLGIASYVVREAELSPSQIDSAFTINALASLGIGLILLVLSYPAAYALNEEGVGAVLRILAIRPLLAVFEFRPMAMLQRELQFRTIAVITTVAACANVGIMIALALAGWSYLSMSVGVVIGGAVSALSYAVFVRHHARYSTSLSEWRSITRFGLRMLTVSGVAQLGSRIAEIVIGRLLGLASLGIFTRATQISDLIYFNIYGSVIRVVFSKLSDDHRRHGRLHETYLQSLRMITAVMWPLASGVAIFSKPLIFVLYGEKWLGAAEPLSIVMVALIVAHAFSMNWEIFVIKDETARQTRIEIARSIAGVSAAAAGSLVSVAAAACGRLTDCVVGFVLYLPHIRRLTGVTMRELGQVYANSAVLSGAAVLPGLLFMASAGWPSRPPLTIAGGTVVLGIVLWIALLALSRHPLIHELARVRLMLPRAARGRGDL